MKIKDELISIVAWLNENYNQDSENYSIFCGSKPGIIKYNKHTAISPWACGAIVCIYDQLYFLSEDDGNWWINENAKTYAYQNEFSIGWADSFASALNNLKQYVWENGEPIYYSGLPEKIVCHYRLTDNLEY